jgi:hypothetical protein
VALRITIHKHIACHDLNALVTETYGRPYDLQQQDGCMERGSIDVSVPEDPDDYERTAIPEVVNGEEMGVSFAAWLARDPKAPVGDRADTYAIGLFWERNFYPHLSMVLNDLHTRGLLEAGEYSIVIDW